MCRASFTAANMNPKSTTPKTHMAMDTTRPAPVDGTMSPYPTVVMVDAENQTTSQKSSQHESVFKELQTARKR